jgi:F0F1-type ATP synthase membrane subunit b/b'
VSPADGHGIPWKELVLPQITNFVIFVAALSFILKKPLKEHFSGKSQEFEDLKKKAEAARRQAEQQNFEVHRLVKEHDETADKSLAEARKDAEDLKLKMVSEAKTGAQRTTEEAQKMTEFEWQRAVAALRLELVETSTRQAQSVLSNEATETVRTRLNEEVIRRIETAPAVGGRA